MSTRREVNKAVALYDSFRERKPTRIANLRVRLPKAVAVMGYVEGVDYRTTHGKKVRLYHHDFAPGSRPLLAVSADGKQLLLLGGHYQFTERGIVDKDARGREVENHRHGKTVNPRGLWVIEKNGKFYVAGQGYTTTNARRASAYPKRDAQYLAERERARALPLPS